MVNYAFKMHIQPIASRPTHTPTGSPRVIPHPAAVTVRPARLGDVTTIQVLVAEYAAEGLMLPRTEHQVRALLEQYIVAADRSGRILACAALDEYSPSLAEVSSVAVARSAQGRGLGSAVVLGVERMAAQRDIAELFAVSLSDEFFLSLGYGLTSIARYPEKLARYDALREGGLDVRPKRCWRKALGA